MPLNKSEEMDLHVDDLQNVKTEVVGFFFPYLIQPLLILSNDHT